MIGLARLLAALAFAVPAAAVAAPAQAQQNQPIVVNGRALSQTEVEQLVALYGQVYVGRFWYDPASGLYGYEGQAALGQLQPGLALGGPLQASASGGGSGMLTGVFVNGREIHPTELAFLQRLYGQVTPGRYWMNAAGLGGFEGGPAQFDVAQAARRAGVYGGGSGSYYLPGIAGQPGTHVGRASDGCVYVSQGGYSNDFC